MAPRKRIDLAEAAMGGDREALQRLAAHGFVVDTIGALYAIMQDAREEMTPAERKLDAERASQELTALLRGRGLS